MYKIIFLLLSITFVLHTKEYNKSEKESSKGHFTYIGFEGEAGWEKVDLYTFLNIESPL